MSPVRFALAATFTLALSACTFTTDPAPQSAGTLALPSSPAAATGLGKTVIDDKAVQGAYLTLDFATTLVDFALDAKKLTPKTPVALSIASTLDTTRTLINGADALQKAGQADAYDKAISEGQAALRNLLAVVKGDPK